MERSIELDFDEAKELMMSIAPKVILLQLPSGLKRWATKIADDLRRNFKCEVIISGDSCFGACDISEADLHLADVIVQVGHSAIPSLRLSKPLVFIPGRLTMDLESLIQSALPLLTSPVGLLAVSQHLHQLRQAQELLRGEDIEAKIGKGSHRLASPGHVLGCDLSSAREISDSVSSFLLLGGGRFHSMGVRLVTRRPVVILDPERSEAVLDDTDVDAFIRRRYVLIERLKEAESIGILLNVKLGQRQAALAERLRGYILEAGKKCEMIAINEITPEKLIDLGFDAYVSTACPRIALDDSNSYSSPIATASELMISLSKAEWEEYRIDDLDSG